MTAPHVKPTFVDVGAEKGEFSRVLIELGFNGVLCEPFPGHAAALEALVEGTDSKFLQVAIDDRDHSGTLHVACDEEGRPRDVFHSLVPLSDHPVVHHAQSLAVECRSLASLAAEGLLPAEIGILKIDTEGNDLQVIAGLGRLRPQALICEFHTPGLYDGWDSFPEPLIDKASSLGYQSCLAVKHYKGCELVDPDPRGFVAGQWGNLFFFDPQTFSNIEAELRRMSLESEQALFDELDERQRRLVAKEEVIQDMHRQLLAKDEQIRQRATRAGAT